MNYSKIVNVILPIPTVRNNFMKGEETLKKVLLLNIKQKRRSATRTTQNVVRVTHVG
ncbi:hypothetical protein MNBD_PLANCTO02-1560 [hydrothermal vent metagenome]|uniref:Uncharacterized protein n=1 Tax=hydrothermal vent metagenome TaxID=652676 RepID=A0A3B1DRZ3_9ZZZZ